MMKKRSMALALTVSMTVVALAGCGGGGQKAATTAASTTAGAEGGTQKAEGGSAGWPVKTLEIICPDSTGTGTDLTARVLAPYLEKELGITVVVTSKSGGGSTLCSQACMDAPNDGSTMMLMHNAFVATKIWGTVDYDYRDVSMVANLYIDPTSLLCANTSSGITSFQDLVDRSKAEPESVNTVCDIGSIIYLEVSSLEDALDIRLGKADAGGVTERIATVVGGHADTVILSVSSLKSYIDAGELVPLAMLNGQKSDLLPDVPTVEECGYDWYWPVSASALFLPPDTDPELVATMSEAIKNICADEGFIKELEEVQGGSFLDYRDTEDAIALWDEMRQSQETAYEAMSAGQ